MPRQTQEVRSVASPGVHVSWNDGIPGICRMAEYVPAGMRHMAPTHFQPGKKMCIFS